MDVHGETARPRDGEARDTFPKWERTPARMVGPSTRTRQGYLSNWSRLFSYRELLLPLRMAIVVWIERTYPRRRKQIGLGRLPPPRVRGHHETPGCTGRVTNLSSIPASDPSAASRLSRTGAEP